MPFAFGHLIGAWIAGRCYEHFSKKKITRYGWLFLLLGGILPDIDFLLDWTLGTQLHRTFTHSLLFLIIVPLLVYLIFATQKNYKNPPQTSHSTPKYGVCTDARSDRRIFRMPVHKKAEYFSILLCIGIMMHLFLDFFSLQGIPLLWPSTFYFSPFGIAHYQTELALMSVSRLMIKIKFAIIEMALGTTWIFYLLLRKKISFSSNMIACRKCRSKGRSFKPRDIFVHKRHALISTVQFSDLMY